MKSEKIIQFEKEIAELLIKKLQHKEITEERAAKIAKFVTDSLPENLTEEQLEKIIPSLDSEFWELAEVVHDHFQAYEDANEKRVQTLAEKFIHQGKIDEASRLMKQFFANDHI